MRQGDQQYKQYAIAMFAVRIWASAYAQLDVEFAENHLAAALLPLSKSTRLDLVQRFAPGEIADFQPTEILVGAKTVPSARKNSHLNATRRMAAALQEASDCISIKSKLVEALTAAVTACRPAETTKFEQKLVRLGDMLHLADHELKFIEFLFINPSIARSRSSIRPLSVNELKRYLFEAVGCTEDEADALFDKNGRLAALKIVDVSDYFGTPGLGRHIVDLLHGSDFQSPFKDLFEESDLDVASTQDLIVSPLDLAVIKGLLGQSVHGTNILLHGSPGTGKTTMAHAVAKDLGLTVYRIKSQKDDAEKERAAALLCACEMLSRTPNVLILVDEADQLLCTRNSWSLFGRRTDKGWLNNFLETSKKNIIWIANDISGTEESTLRRFSFALDFGNTTAGHRSRIWETCLRQTKLPTGTLAPDDIEILATEFHVNAGPIVDALKSVAAMNLDAAETRQALFRLLESYQQRSAEKSPRYHHVFNLDGLNIDQDPQPLLKTLGRFKANAAGHADRRLAPRNINLLLSGPPGTGKTEFARYVAQHLAAELVTKTASDILSMYVGACEQNIVRTFREAEKSGAILFIDEADSLFTARSTAHRSWEVSRTNEMLSCMENFSGILICATNFLDSIDSAALRRFAFKLKFDCLTNHGKGIIFKKVLGGLLAEAASDQMLSARLEAIDPLTPGDFKVVRQKLLYMDLHERSLDLIVTHLSQEAASKRLCPQIGF